MDTIIKVEESLCIKCDACIRCCPGPVITKDAESGIPVPTTDSWDLCIDCGHCVAVCPTDALDQRAMGPEECEPVDFRLTPSWDQTRQLMVTRRAIRGYVHHKQVEEDKILKLLNVSSHAPSGGNRQVLRWVVINDHVKVQRIAELTIDWMRSVKDANPALYQEAKLGMFIENWEAGKDVISRGAPCIIQAWAPQDERTAPPAAWIASAHIQLAATTLGLGTTFCEAIGFASRSYPPLLEFFGRPEGEIPHTSFLIGYPTEFYHRIPKRNPINATWL